MQDVNKQKLMSDIKVVIHDAESLLAQASAASGEQAVELRQKATNALRHAREKLLDIQDEVVYKTKRAATATDDYVHEHPWHAIGVAAAVGLVVGVLIGRR